MGTDWFPLRGARPRHKKLVCCIGVRAATLSGPRRRRCRLPRTASPLPYPTIVSCRTHVRVFWSFVGHWRDRGSVLIADSAFVAKHWYFPKWTWRLSALQIVFGMLNVAYGRIVNIDRIIISCNMCRMGNGLRFFWGEGLDLGSAVLCSGRRRRAMLMSHVSQKTSRTGSHS